MCHAGIAPMLQRGELVRRVMRLDPRPQQHTRLKATGRGTKIQTTEDVFNRTAGSKLAAGQHQRIGYIGGWEGASTQRDREKGFSDELTRNGQSLYAREIGNFNLDEARQAARKMFTRKDFPDAVFVANDAMAIAVIDVIRFELGLKVPEQVSVVGYDDVPISSSPAYDLTTVRQPANRMVAETVSILIENIENKTTTARRIEIDGPLMVRGSAKISDA